MERGPRYNKYAQLRESNLQSKRFKLYEIEENLEVPNSEFSPILKKSVKFHGDLGGFEDDFRVSGLRQPGFLTKSVKCDENVKVCEIPKSEFSPILKKSVRFNRNLDEFEGDHTKKSVKFDGFSGDIEENVIPRSKYSPILKKSVTFNEKTGRKQGSSVMAQSVPDFSSVLRKENRRPTPENGKNIKGGKLATPPVSKTRDKMYGSVSKYGVVGGGSKSVNSGEKQGNVRGIMGRKSYASIEELKGLSIVAGNAINKESKTRKSNVFTTRFY